MDMSLRGLLIAISLVVGGIVLVLFSLYVLFQPGQTFWSAFYDINRVQGGAAIVGLLVGAIGTLAGAAASIQIALLGLSVSRKQESFAVVNFLDEKFDQVAGIHARLALAISGFYAAAIRLHMNLPPGLTARFSADPAQAIPEELRHEYEGVLAALDKLVAALEAVAGDGLAQSALRAGLEARREALELPLLTARQIEAGIAESEAKISIEDVIDVLHLVEMARHRLADRSLGSVVTAALIANLPNNVLGAPYDHAGVRSFFFCGTLLLSRVEQGESLRVFYLGNGILHDLIVAMPNTVNIHAVLARTYPHAHAHVDRLMARFEPRQYFSSGLMTAIEDVPTVGAAYSYGPAAAPEPAGEVDPQ